MVKYYPLCKLHIEEERSGERTDERLGRRQVGFGIITQRFGQRQ